MSVYCDDRGYSEERKLEGRRGGGGSFWTCAAVQYKYASQADICRYAGAENKHVRRVLGWTSIWTSDAMHMHLSRTGREKAWERKTLNRGQKSDADPLEPTTCLPFWEVDLSADWLWGANVLGTRQIWKARLQTGPFPTVALIPELHSNISRLCDFFQP